MWWNSVDAIFRFRNVRSIQITYLFRKEAFFPTSVVLLVFLIVQFIWIYQFIYLSPCFNFRIAMPLREIRLHYLSSIFNFCNHHATALNEKLIKWGYVNKYRALSLLGYNFTCARSLFNLGQISSNFPMHCLQPWIAFRCCNELALNKIKK